MPNRHPSRRPRRLHALVALAAAVAAGACSDFLQAENPAAIEADQLTSLGYVSLLTNGAIFGFQDSYDDVVYWNAQFTDELHNRAVFVEEGQIDRRELYSDMTYINAFLYAPMQRARFQAEDAAARLKTILGDSASRDLRVARALAYAGHSYIALGEMMCVTPIDKGAPKTSEEIFADAIARLDEAATIAAAFKAAVKARTTVSAADTLAADSVRHFALVGAARAALNRNDKPRAIAAASQVPASFVFYNYYSENTPAQRNRTWERLTAGANATALNTPFAAITGDPRVTVEPGTTGRGGIPRAPTSYTSYTGALPLGAAFTPTQAMRVASGLEARYIVAEAQGPTAATLAFVNERRAFGQQAAVTLTGDALMAELREQRARDFYLDGHRLGDLRRYKKYYNVDLFPKGPYPGSTSGQVYNESVDCWPLPTNEILDNPNIPRG